MEFQLDLIQYLTSIYINCSLCAQKCIRSFTINEKAGPALKDPSVWRRCVLWKDVLWSHGKLWFCISGWEGKMPSATEESRWCEQRGMQTLLTVHEIREYLFSKHTLHLDLTTGIFGELTLKAHVFILEVILTWKETVIGFRVGYVVHFFDFANMGRRTWGRCGKRLELPRALSSSWEAWECGKEWFSPWICWDKKESQTWSLWTNPSYPRLCQDRGWEFPALIQVMRWSQDRPLVSSCFSVIVIHCTAVREIEVSFPFEQYEFYLSDFLWYWKFREMKQIISCGQSPKASKRIKIEWGLLRNTIFLFLLCLWGNVWSDELLICASLFLFSSELKSNILKPGSKELQ